MNIKEMITKASSNAPPPPSSSEANKESSLDFFSGSKSSNSVSWNDSNFFAGKGKSIYEWNLKDMLHYCEEQYSLICGKKPGFAIRPAMMAMSGLRSAIEHHFGKKEVNNMMRAYIEWYIKDIRKNWKGNLSYWYPQKMVSDQVIKKFINNNAMAKDFSNSAHPEEFVKRPINPILLEEFYRGDSSDFVAAYGIVVVAAFLIKTKDFCHEDAVNFIIDSCDRLISSGKLTFSQILKIDEHYRPFDRFSEIDPEGLLISVKNRFQ